MPIYSETTWVHTTSRHEQIAIAIATGGTTRRLYYAAVASKKKKHVWEKIKRGKGRARLRIKTARSMFLFGPWSIFTSTFTMILKFYQVIWSL